MPRATFTGPIAHTSDATFRAWVGEMENLLSGCGLVRTADSGQIDVATVLRPAVNTKAGYSMWRFDDPLQSTAPVFIKISYGTSISTATHWGAWYQFGTATNGSGTLTGMVSPEIQTIPATTPSTALDLRSFACHVDGFAFLLHKADGVGSGASYQPGLFFAVQRTVDNAGVPTADGILIIAPTSANGVTDTQRTFWMRFSGTPFAPVAWSATAPPCVVPMAPTDSKIGGISPQVFLSWIMLPKMMPMLYTAATIRGEVTPLSQQSLTLVGTTPRNYLWLSRYMLNAGLVPGASGTYMDTVVLWED